MPIVCIYRIKNIVNGKFYIGSSLDWRKRKSGHLSELRNGNHSNEYLQRSWNKYGESAFVFEILEDLPGFDNQSLRDAEWWWINNTYCYRPQGYNLTLSAVGYEFSDAHKQAMAKSQKTRVLRVAPEVSKKRRSDAGKKRFADLFADPAGHKAYVEKWKEITNRPEVKAKSIAGGHKVWKDPELKRKMLDSYHKAQADGKTKWTPERKKAFIAKQTGVPCPQCTRHLWVKVEQWKGDKLIKTFDSIINAVRETGFTHIQDCLGGLRKTAGGFKWKRAK